MGPVITINSATLVNKGLEVIEAHLLFGMPFDRIEVVVHPTSVVHSMVEFVDGSTLVQASPPTMLIPIALGLAWPDRVPDAAPAGRLDHGRRPGSSSRSTTTPSRPSSLARAAGERGGTAPAVYNAANEVCVDAFLAGGMAFADIVPTIAARARRPRRTLGGARPHRGRRPRRRLLGARRGRPPDPRGDSHRMTVLLYALGVIVFVLAILVSIGLHEVGHMVPAKKFGGKVTQYFIGFGRTVWSQQVGETEYGFKAFPLGGYVKIVGMLPPGHGRASARSSTTPTATRTSRSASPTPACSPSWSPTPAPRSGRTSTPRTPTASSTRWRGGRRSS